MENKSNMCVKKTKYDLMRERVQKIEERLGLIHVNLLVRSSGIYVSAMPSMI